MDILKMFPYGFALADIVTTMIVMMISESQAGLQSQFTTTRV